MDHFDKPKNMKTLKVLYQHIVLTTFIAFLFFSFCSNGSCLLHFLLFKYYEYLIPLVGLIETFDHWRWKVKVRLGLGWLSLIFLLLAPALLSSPCWAFRGYPGLFRGFQQRKNEQFAFTRRILMHCLWVGALSAPVNANIWMDHRVLLTPIVSLSLCSTLACLTFAER